LTLDKASETDVLVVGGGPAGTALALTLLRYSPRTVVVAERTGYHDWRIGETLPPGVEQLLAWLGAGEVLAAHSHLLSAGTAAAWGSSALVERQFLFTGRGEGWHLDRRRFDAALADLVVRAGGTRYDRTTLEDASRCDDGRWRVTLVDTDGGRRDVMARFVVDATGRAAVLAQRLGAKQQRADRLVGVAGVFEFAEGAPRDSFTLVEAVPEGWWYAALLPGGSLAVVLMSDSDLVRQGGWHSAANWQALLSNTLHMRFRSAGGTLSGGVVIRTANSQRLDAASGNGWVAIGDAAVAYDPLSSMGIGYALSSGINAARAIDAALGGHPEPVTDYAADVARHFIEFRQLQRQYYGLEQRWPESAFWARRHYPTVFPENVT
jgi:flavin-dependent dehydrogenase